MAQKDYSTLDTKRTKAISRLEEQDPKECAATILDHQLTSIEVFQVLLERDIFTKTFDELATLARQKDVTLDFFYQSAACCTNSDLANILSLSSIIVHRLTYHQLRTLLSSEGLHNVMERLRVYRRVNNIPRAELASFLDCPEHVDLSPLKYSTEDIPSSSASEWGDNDEDYSITPPQSPVPEEVKQILRRRKIINNLASTEMSLRVSRIFKYEINEAEIRGSINGEAEVKNTLDCFLAYVKGKAKANECKREDLAFMKGTINLKKFPKRERSESPELRVKRIKLTAAEINSLTTLDEARDLLLRISNTEVEKETVPNVAGPIMTGLNWAGKSYNIPSGFYFLKSEYAFFSHQLITVHNPSLPG